MGRLDLDQHRAARDAARAEAGVEPHVLVFRGQEFALPAELPAEFAWALEANDVKAALREALGDRFDEFWSLRPSMDDLPVLAHGVAGLYAQTLGESSASVGSSPNGSSPSRLTSLATTDSTSAAPSGDQTAAVSDASGL